MATRIQWRRDTAADWTSVNPVLAEGEAGVEIGTGKFKLGDGATAWVDLDYAAMTPDEVDTAVDNATSNLAVVASTGEYADLLNPPSLGTAADNAETDFATAAQGTKADSAVQPADLPFVNVLDYGATGDGITDDTAAVQAALTVGGGGVVWFPEGDYLAANLNASVANTVILGPGQIVKNANGPVLTLSANYITIRDLRIDGQGATFTGAGIVYNGMCYRSQVHAHIDDTAGPCHDFSGASGNGAASTVSGFARRTTPTLPAIALPAAESNGDRSIKDLYCGGGILCDTAGTSTLLITGCNMGGITFGAASVKVAMSANRIAQVAGTIIRGGDHAIVGNVFGGNVELAADCTRSAVVGNATDGTFTDNGTLNQMVGNA